MEFPRRVFDGEGVKADVDFGPTLMLNRNRCILCTRCVRFMKEIDTDAQISIVDRGGGSEIATFQEEGIHSLLSGNLMDVCPVGAITTRDYRFKSRPWDNPDAVDTICTLCSKGCNTTAWIKAKPEWAKGARLVRMTPRLNHEVNGYWMCDIGRFQYHWIESEDRLRKPLVRAADGTQAPSTWDARAGGSRHGGGRARAERLHVPGLRARIERRTLRDPAPGQRDCAHVAVQREEAASGHEVPRAAGGRAERERRPRPRPADRCRQYGRRPTFRPFAPTSRPVASRRSTCSIQAPTDRWGMSRGSPEARRSGKLQLLVYQGVLLTEIGACGRHRAARRRVGREGIDLHERPGPRAGRREGIRPPGDARDDRDIFLAVAKATGQAVPFTTVGGAAARARGRARRQPGVRRHRRHPVLAPGQRAQLAAGIEPVRALEVGLHVPGRAAGQVRLDAAAQLAPDVIPLRPVEELERQQGE